MNGYWRQCTLKRDTATTVAWIPEWAAQPGNVVTRSDGGGLDGFRVTSVGDLRLKDDAAREMERRQRRFKANSSLARQCG